MVNQSNISLAGKLCILFPALLAIIWGPIAFGGSTPDTGILLDILLFTTVLLWGVCNAFETRLPKYSKWVMGSLIIIAGLSGLQLMNAKSFLNRETWTLVESGGAIAWLPGTIDRMSSFPVIRHFVALGLFLLVLIDLASDRSVKWWILRVVAISGLIIALIGISQKAGNAEVMLWSSEEQSGNWFFGAFHYHANAAAFICSPSVERVLPTLV